MGPHGGGPQVDTVERAFLQLGAQELREAQRSKKQEAHVHRPQNHDVFHAGRKLAEGKTVEKTLRVVVPASHIAIARHESGGHCALDDVGGG